MENPEDRLSVEISLLESMYPDQVQYNEKAREVSYKSTGNLLLRLPNGYLTSELPEVLSATTDAGTSDLRERLRERIGRDAAGEEVLDSVLSTFDELVEAVIREADTAPNGSSVTSKKQLEDKATTVVWLHHLLNTNKRKLALAPSLPNVSGVTKPGYPGVLVYSGPASAVHEHVNELKGQNWQAFQVRLEDDEEWIFAHGRGIIEVEAMKDVVAEIGDPTRKDLFLEAMRMK